MESDADALLDKKLACWAGLQQLCTPEDDVYGRGIWTFGTMRFDTPDFTKSLDACFSWLEQPLVNYFISKTESEDEFREAYLAFLTECLSDYVWREPHKLAEAICNGIEKLIDLETESDNETGEARLAPFEDDKDKDGLW